MIGQAIITEEQVVQFQVQKKFSLVTPPNLQNHHVTFYRSDVKHALQEDGAIQIRGVFSSQWVDVVKSVIFGRSL